MSSSPGNVQKDSMYSHEGLLLQLLGASQLLISQNMTRLYQELEQGAHQLEKIVAQKEAQTTLDILGLPKLFALQAKVFNKAINAPSAENSVLYTKECLASLIRMGFVIQGVIMTLHKMKNFKNVWSTGELKFINQLLLDSFKILRLIVIFAHSLKQGQVNQQQVAELVRAVYLYTVQLWKANNKFNDLCQFPRNLVNMAQNLELSLLYATRRLYFLGRSLPAEIHAALPLAPQDVARATWITRSYRQWEARLLNDVPPGTAILNMGGKHSMAALGESLKRQINGLSDSLQGIMQSLDEHDTTKRLLSLGYQLFKLSIVLGEVTAILSLAPLSSSIALISFTSSAYALQAQCQRLLLDSANAEDWHEFSVKLSNFAANAYKAFAWEMDCENLSEYLPDLKAATRRLYFVSNQALRQLMHSLVPNRVAPALAPEALPINDEAPVNPSVMAGFMGLCAVTGLALTVQHNQTLSRVIEQDFIPERPRTVPARFDDILAGHEPGALPVRSETLLGP